LVYLGDTLEVTESLKMLFRREQIEENIVLRADTQEVSNFIHIFEEVNTKYFCEP
jgi:hypothetical protein